MRIKPAQIMALNNLNGAAVLITRPKHQNENLAKWVKDAGGKPLLLPTIEISPHHPDADTLATLNRLEHYDAVIFISRNAVDFALPLFAQANSSLSQQVKIGAIGRSTAAALQQQGYATDWCPSECYNSEAFLRLAPTQQVDKLNILIVRGQGGREVLAEHLRARGATVHYLEVYQRLVPSVAHTDIENIFFRQKPSIVTASSLIGLKHLYKMLPQSCLPLLQNIPLIVVNDSMLKFAQQQGFNGPLLLAQNATDQRIMEMILNYFTP